MEYNTASYNKIGQASNDLMMLEKYVSESSEVEIKQTAGYLLNRVKTNVEKIQGTSEENLVFRYHNVLRKILSVINEEVSASKLDFADLKSIEKSYEWMSKSNDYNEFSGIENYDQSMLKDFEAKILGCVEGSTIQKNEMSVLQRAFLHGIIRKVKPKTIVEMGVSAGGSSSVILNAIRDMDDSRLYSYEYSLLWYPEKNKSNARKSGFLVDQVIPEGKHKWNFFVGGFPCKYLQSSLPCEGVDLCFIDTAHVNPGEHLNILEILPFMKKNGIIIYHDTSLYLSPTQNSDVCTTNRVSINTLKGQRIILTSEGSRGIANIEGVVLDDINRDTLYLLFTNLSLPWEYTITEHDFESILKHFTKYYPNDLTQLFIFFYHFYSKIRFEKKETALEFAKKESDKFKMIMPN